MVLLAFLSSRSLRSALRRKLSHLCTSLSLHELALFPFRPLVVGSRLARFFFLLLTMQFFAQPGLRSSLQVLSLGDLVAFLSISDFWLESLLLYSLLQKSPLCGILQFLAFFFGFRLDAMFLGSLTLFHLFVEKLVILHGLETCLNLTLHLARPLFLVLLVFLLLLAHLLQPHVPQLLVTSPSLLMSPSILLDPLEPLCMLSLNLSPPLLLQLLLPLL
mmetsp:Transcript_37480/g.99617  ORF Transcript_37480/g.99617 Transcript_37480/m.99617 type:complete len:218 (-) Transcript_37480:290-943(-)